MECFIEILTNQRRSFFNCTLKSSNFCIIFMINVYECILAHLMLFKATFLGQGQTNSPKYVFCYIP